MKSARSSYWRCFLDCAGLLADNDGQCISSSGWAECGGRSRKCQMHNPTTLAHGQVCDAKIHRPLLLVLPFQFCPSSCPAGGITSEICLCSFIPATTSPHRSNWVTRQAYERLLSGGSRIRPNVFTTVSSSEFGAELQSCY